MVVMAPLSPPSKRKPLRSRRSLLALFALTTIVALWQVGLHLSSLEARLPLMSRRALLQDFNATELSKVQSQLTEIKKTLAEPSGLDKDQGTGLSLQIEHTLGLVKDALHKIEVLETQTHQRLGSLENATESLNLLTDRNSNQLRTDGDSQNDTTTATRFEILTEKLIEEIDVLKEEDANLKRRSDQVVTHIAATTPWQPLIDLQKFRDADWFLPDIVGRGSMRGPPELFEFPSEISLGRHLCFLGNSSRNGTRNFYTFSWEEAIPKNTIMFNGTTLITNTQYDFGNPWHSMYNMVQFVYWKQTNGCPDVDRLLLYHWGELRRSMGPWISQVFASASLPAIPDQMDIGNQPICFERAIVSRSGLGGVPANTLQDLYKEVRCLVRNYCKVPVSRPGPSIKQSVHITLVVRSGGREWKNRKEWEAVIARECVRVDGCHWGTMPVSNMSFCEQVETMSKTDILVSVHGAQLTNMIFMSPGGRILEMFPYGWLELAGHGQYIYKHLSDWVGLRHAGYWRDVANRPACPFEGDNSRCMTFYKDQPVGINITHISTWLSDVIRDFNSKQTDMAKPPINSTDSGLQIPWDSSECICSAQSKAFR